MKWYIKTRKKIILPLKWMFVRRKRINESGIRSIEEIFAKGKEIQEQLSKAQRLSGTQGVEEFEAQLHLLNWIITDDNSKE